MAKTLVLDSASDIANVWSASMAGMQPAEYVNELDALAADLPRIAKLVDATSVKSTNDYMKASKLKGILTSLHCYFFNSDRMDEWRQLLSIETKLGNAMYKYVLKNTAKGRYNLYLRYLLWNRRFEGDVRFVQWMLDELLTAGYLYWRAPYKSWPDDEHGNPGRFMLTGLHVKLGDNTARYDSMGRLHPCYYTSCAWQCFFLKERHEVYLKHREDIPELPQWIDKEGISFRKGKHGARNPKITDADRRELHKLMEELQLSGALNKYGEKDYDSED